MLNSNFSEKVSQFEKVFADYIRTRNLDGVFQEALEYATLGAGKRIRPVIMQYSCETLGIRFSDGLQKLAIALELIHNYSLVHDDLPCMDNDDYRRGKPTVHKAFGEDVAVLIGDELLNLSFEVAVDAARDDAKCLNCTAFLAQAAEQMIRGQSIDVTTTILDENTLLNMYQGKTCALITAATVIPAIYCDRSIKEFLSLGKNIGMIFQLTDDIIDGNQMEKNNYYSMFGKERTISKISKNVLEAKIFLENFGAISASFANLIDLIAYRTN